MTITLFPRISYNKLTKIIYWLPIRKKFLTFIKLNRVGNYLCLQLTKTVLSILRKKKRKLIIYSSLDNAKSSKKLEYDKMNSSINDAKQRDPSTVDKNPYNYNVEFKN